MNLNRLRYFTVVAEELHFGRAAARLHMAQPPLSQQIRQLENEVGVALFERTTRSVELTDAGKLLVPEAQRVVAEADGIERLMAEYRAGQAGRLRIGFVDSSSYAVMPEFLRSYRERWPQVTFELHSMSSDAQRIALPAGELDLGIARTRGNEPGLRHTLIHEERLFAAVPANHRLAGQQSTTLAKLADEAFIGFTRTQSPALTQELVALLEQSNVVYDPIIEADEYTTIVGLVAAGEGVAIVPETVRSFQPPNLQYVRLRDADATTRLMLLTREDEQLRVVHQALELAADLFDVVP